MRPAHRRAMSIATVFVAGLPGRPWYEHQIYAPGVNQGYGTQLLPGINDALFLRNNPAEARRYEAYLYASLQAVTATLSG